MRILFLNKASPKHEGGAEIRTREIGKRLVAAGHEVTVLAAKTSLKDAPFEVVDGMRLYHKKVLPDWLLRRFPAPHYLPLAAANLVLMVHLYFFLKKERFDAIREDLSPFPPSFLSALIRLPVRSRIAVVHNLPGTLAGWFRHYGPVYGSFGFLFDRLLRGGRLQYDRIVCVAKWLAEDLNRSPRLAGKVHYIPNGVDVARFSSVPRAPRSDARKGDGIVRLLSVGRLVALKGYRYLIEALSYLKDARLRLTLVGQGPLKDSLLRLATERGVRDLVEIRPPVPNAELPRLYAESDVLVFPSLTEGLPMTLLEAMAAGLPIVATDIPGVRDILDEDSAFLAASRDAVALADALKRALERPDEAHRKAQAAREIVKNYDWDRAAEQENHLITGLMPTGTRTPS